MIMVTGFGSIQTAVEAMRLGAADYVTKPHNNDELLIKIRKTLVAREKDQELRQLRQELQSTYSYANIITRSDRMREVLTQIRQVADTDVTILVQGESGTGKELGCPCAAFQQYAEGVHRSSPRTVRRSVRRSWRVNCSGTRRERSPALPLSAGDVSKRPIPGRCSWMRSATSRRGYRRNCSGCCRRRRLSGSAGQHLFSVDTRVVVATNRNLEVMVREGDFREDLFYRLNVFPITLPPLRERLEDIPLLVEAFLQKHGALSGGRVRFVAPDVVTSMMQHPWKGNIRELENLMKRAIIKCPGDTVRSVDLPAVPGARG